MQVFKQVIQAVIYLCRSRYTREITLPDISFSEINWSETLGNIEKIVTIAAVLVGGIWTYLRFIKGRIYCPRLRPSVEGRMAQIDGRRHLVATLTIENVGTSKVDLNHKAMGLRLLGPTMQPCAAPPVQVRWMQLGTFDVFEKHGWIENGEVIQDQVVIAVPEGITAFSLEFRAAAQKSVWQSKSTVESRI